MWHVSFHRFKVVVHFLMCLSERIFYTILKFIEMLSNIWNCLKLISIHFSANLILTFNIFLTYSIFASNCLTYTIVTGSLLLFIVLFCKNFAICIWLRCIAAWSCKWFNRSCINRIRLLLTKMNFLRKAKNMFERFMCEKWRLLESKIVIKQWSPFTLFL